MMIKQLTPRRQGDAGFTLLELLVVLAILGLLAAIIAPQVIKYLGTSRTQTAKVQIQNVVAALELYGTSIGTWRWAERLPGLGIPDGNPPSGAASGYVWFDVMALLVAPWLVTGGRAVKARLLPAAATA